METKPKKHLKKSKTFDKIIKDFRRDIDKYLEERNYTRDCVQIEINQNYPSGVILKDLYGNVVCNMAI